MRLVVVYGLKTADYRYMSEFYPARRLSEECANRSLPLRFLFPPDVPAFVREESQTKDETVCLIRGTVAPETVRLLEEAGYRCLNSSRSLALAGDKLASARFLSEGGWPSPLTREAHTYTGTEAPFFPLIAKPRFGSRGAGVRLVHGFEEVRQLGADYLLQEYIEHSRGRDLRVLFAGDRILAATVREAAEGRLLSNACDGAKTTLASGPSALSEDNAAMALAIGRGAGLWYGSVDFLFCPGDPQTLTVCELNGAPGFEALERDCRINLAGALIDALIDDYSRY